MPVSTSAMTGQAFPTSTMVVSSSMDILPVMREQDSVFRLSERSPNHTDGLSNTTTNIPGEHGDEFQYQNPSLSWPVSLPVSNTHTGIKRENAGVRKS